MTHPSQVQAVLAEVAAPALPFPRLGARVSAVLVSAVLVSSRVQPFAA
jgi:hypothetical protein